MAILIPAMPPWPYRLDYGVLTLVAALFLASILAHRHWRARIRLEDQLIRVVGDLAYELGVERGALKLVGQQAAIAGRVTNIYRREAGKWKIVHHHTDISPAMLEVLNHSAAKA